MSKLLVSNFYKQLTIAEIPCDMAYFHQPIRIELQLCSIAQPEERETQIVLLGYDAHFCLQLILFVGLVHVVMTVAVNVFGRLLI